MRHNSDVKRVIKLLTNYSEPWIIDIKKAKAKLYSDQFISEECIVCKVYSSKEEYDERIALDFDNPNFPPRLIFPEYYLTLSDNEILKDLSQREIDNTEYEEETREKRFKNNDSRLRFTVNLTKEQFDLLVKNNILDKKDWDRQYRRLCESYPLSDFMYDKRI